MAATDYGRLHIPRALPTNPVTPPSTPRSGVNSASGTGLAKATPARATSIVRRLLSAVILPPPAAEPGQTECNFGVKTVRLSDLPQKSHARLVKEAPQFPKSSKTPPRTTRTPRRRVEFALEHKDSERKDSERKEPERKEPERVSVERKMPERVMSERKMPEPLSSDRKSQSSTGCAQSPKQAVAAAKRLSISHRARSADASPKVQVQTSRIAPRPVLRKLPRLFAGPDSCVQAFAMVRLNCGRNTTHTDWLNAATPEELARGEAHWMAVAVTRDDHGEVKCRILD